MKAFRFRLESLLQLREISRDKALAQYAKAINFRQLKEGELRSRETNLKNLHSQISEKRQSSFTGSNQETFELSKRHANEQIIDANKHLQRSCKTEEAKKNIYLKADSSYKSLLRLKEKQFEEHFRSESLKEERDLEDVIGGRFVFNNLANQSL